MAESSTGAATRKRGKGRPFEKGQSGNPGGRKKMPEEVKEILRAAAPKAAELLVQMLDDPATPAKLRLQAAETVLDRVYGKASQPIEGNIDNKIEIIMGGLERYAD